MSEVQVRRPIPSIALPAVAVLLLGGCIGPLAGGSGASSARYPAVSDTPVKIGRPYTVRGVTYAPRADPGYDRLGYATWYGPESGNTTASGERFRPDGISAAHTTLPLPTYAEVTSLDTGRTILVRINDRGPSQPGAASSSTCRAARQSSSA